MRLLINIFILLLVILCVAPFFMKHHDGQPLLHFPKPNFINKIPKIPMVRKIISSSRSKPDTSRSKTYTKIYKWKDKNGVVHYSDRENENAPCEEIHIKTDIPDTEHAPSHDFAKLKEFKNNYLKTAEKRDFINKDLLNEDLINMIFPTSIPITKIPTLIKDTKGLEQLLEDKYSEQLRILNEQ